MTSRELTGLLPLKDEWVDERPLGRRVSDIAWRLTFGAIGWPWLLRSLHGGSKAAKRALIRRLDIADDALPHLGSWKADTALLHRIVDHIERHRPRIVVELGAGASSLVAARALQLHGGGRLYSYDQNAEFVTATRTWLGDHGVTADMRHAPLNREVEGWPGRWYALEGVPETIDLLIIDGPPWSIHPMVRGAADILFARLSPGGTVLLDDAARPGERLVARRWRREHPDINFRLVTDGTKGTLVGTKKGGQNAPGRVAANDDDRMPLRSRCAAAAIPLMAFGAGWMLHGISGDAAGPAQAASFIDEAAASHQTSLIRAPMRSQVETPHLDRQEIVRWTGITLPKLPEGWTIRDVQIYPAGNRPAVEIALTTPAGEHLSLFSQRAETPAEGQPLIAERAGKSIAYWEVGDIAYALTGAVAPAQALGLAAELAGS